jgi:hypothetical protein
MPVARARVVATAQGGYNVASGIWPLLHMRSFEAVLGPKTDRWLVRTVAGLLVTVGAAQLQPGTPVRLARLLGIGSAATFAAIDVTYVAKGRIRKVYLLDAVVEVCWMLAWSQVPAGGPKPDVAAQNRLGLPSRAAMSEEQAQ